MLFVVGLGLGDAKDITVKGLEAVRQADRVILEAYTSILTIGKEALEEYYGKPVEVADREAVEQGAAEMLEAAKSSDVAFLVVGDPFGATTHADLVLRARDVGVQVKVIHNASIMNAVACCGLQLYHFGETVSIPFWTDSWQPDSFYEKICANKTRGLHTLCLLDIQVKEPTPESIMKKVKQYLPPRFMSVAQASEQLLKIIVNDSEKVLSNDSVVIGLARVGAENQQIAACSLEAMKDTDLGSPLHCLVIPGKLHPLEEEYLEQFFVK
ncbi:diphthine methyl ester synthase [Neocloeon triangulifer]|uniref:diphthine methyl ester synthase n=1 Tax=Neocloeon triangulifer TaxID=2078957 RepID=UPI00286EE0AD|nr:diphthine methyl ester synthase [Neocloeon triangulifer]